MSVMNIQRSSCMRVAASRTAVVPRLALSSSRRSAVQVLAFRDDRDKVSSKVTKTANKLTSKAKQATKQATKQGTTSRQGTSSSGNKQRAFLPPNAPRNKKEESESVVAFVAVASLFLTGVLFVFPALLGGSPATTKPLQSGINKAFGIEKPADTSGPSYAPGPGPAAAPGSPATRM